MRRESLAFARYAAALPGFFRRTLSAGDCRRRLAAGLAERERSFLTVLENGVYRRPESPYRRLLDRAGIELVDVARLVSEQGLEGALGRLYEEGVHVRLEEFKGRQPIVRPGLELEVTRESFEHPLLSGARVGVRTSGSRAGLRPALLDLPHLAHDACYQSLFLEAHGLAGRPLAFWRPVPPGAAGLKNVIGFAKLGLPVARWFSQNPLTPRQGLHREYLITTATLLGARLAGATVAHPEHVPVGEARTVARWLATARQDGRPAVLDTTASSGVRVCASALEHGVDIAGTLFRFGGEPLTDGKAAVVNQAGSRAVCNYSMGELGRVGVACGDPRALDDVHIVTDKVAVIQREREVGVAGVRVAALLLTTLVPSCPKLLLNVETDDYGVLEQRECGCALGEVGFSLHLHGIRSYEKLTSEGMNFLGPELLTVVEQVLPSRFGGTATDYQLVEEEVDGLPKVAVVVSPRVGEVDEKAVVEAVLESLAQGPASRGMMAGVWRDGDTLSVVRREPHPTATAKILPLHAIPRR
jgi:hypothetical protein